MSGRNEMDQERLDKLDKSVYQKIGENIKTLQKKENNKKGRTISQEEIANYIEEKTETSCSRETVSNWITAKRRPSIYHILCLCKFFSVSLEYMCGVTGKKHDNEAAERYTMLSRKAVQYLHGLDRDKRHILDEILNKESGLDSILENIVKARRENINLKNTESDIQREIDGYTELKKYCFPDEKKTIKIKGQLQKRLFDYRQRISDYFLLIQLPLLRQENFKRSIRQTFEKILQELIPDAISTEYQDPVYETESILNDEVQKQWDLYFPEEEEKNF